MEANLQTLTPSLGARDKSLSQSAPLGPALSHEYAATASQTSRRAVETDLRDRAAKLSPRQWPPIVFRASIGDKGPGFHLCVPNQPPLVVSYQQLDELVRTAAPWLALLRREFADEGRL
jgi:hypothetical protein